MYPVGHDPGNANIAGEDDPHAEALSITGDRGMILLNFGCNAARMSRSPINMAFLIQQIWGKLQLHTHTY